jgi:xanthine/uracil/vitamin C permease (AzgA family)
MLILALPKVRERRWMANYLSSGVRTATQAGVGVILIVAAGIAALAMLLISSLVVAAGLMLRMKPKSAVVRANPPIINARRTPYGWTADVPGPHA